MGILFSKETTHYYSQIRKYTGLVGSLFSDMYINRVNKDNEVIELIQVPIRYAPGHIRNKGRDTVSDLKYASISPAMSFELVGASPDSIRKTAPYVSYNSNAINSDNKTNSMITPVPHDLIYELTIRSKAAEDAYQIFEQIIGAFNPAVSVTINDNKLVEIERDITIMLDPNYGFDDNWEESESTQRYVTITLSFTVKGYIYKRVKVAPVILEIEVLRQQGEYSDSLFSVIQSDKQKIENANDLLESNTLDLLSNISKGARGLK